MLAFSPEIVQLRESNIANNVTEEPEFDDPGYRVLVEENVKESVCNIANDPAMLTVRLSLVSCPQPPTLTWSSQHWEAFNLEQKGGTTPAARKKRSGGEGGPLKPVFVHGAYNCSNFIPPPLTTCLQDSCTISLPARFPTSVSPLVPRDSLPRVPPIPLSSVTSTPLNMTTSIERWITAHLFK